MLVQTIMTFLVIIALVYIYKQYKTESEELLALKLIGYYLLGSFRFNFNKVALPIGFVIYLLFFRITRNNRAKKAAVYLGLFIFICGLITPSLQKSYFERKREVTVSTNNIYTIDLNKDFKEIKQKLGIRGNVNIQDFRASFEDSGAIKELRYMFITTDKSGFIVYNVNLLSYKNQYVIWPTRANQWLQYNRLIDEEQFLHILERLDIKKEKPQTKYPSYTVECNGDYTNWEVQNCDNFLITDNGPKKIKNEELPINGYIFWISGNKNTGEGSYSSENRKAYIFSGQM